MANCLERFCSYGYYNALFHVVASSLSLQLHSQEQESLVQLAKEFLSSGLGLQEAIDLAEDELDAKRNAQLDKAKLLGKRAYVVVRQMFCALVNTVHTKNSHHNILFRVSLKIIATTSSLRGDQSGKCLHL
jgi:hypothetical protein